MLVLLTSSVVLLVFDAPELGTLLGGVGWILVNIGAVGGMVSLVVWWAVKGFAGFEHTIGMRVVRRQGGTPFRAIPVVVASVIALVGIAMMLMGFRSAAVAVIVALATLAVLVLTVVQLFAVSASLSIVGIAIGVAALLVVQSVSTGFQHEFERRVLSVYAHINVTRTFGIREYRRFESYLRTVDRVAGASPFVYYFMALAPIDGRGEPRRATVLVKGIEPETASEVIDLEQHLARGMENPPSIDALTSELQLQPVRDRTDDRLPPAVAAMSDPRGDDWYPAAYDEWRKLPEHLKYGGRRRISDESDDWPESPDELALTSEDVDKLPGMFVGYALARELSLEVGDVVMLVDPGAGADQETSLELRHYRVAGVFRAGFLEYDNRLVYVNIRELQYFKYRGVDTVSGIDLRLDDPYDATRVEQELSDTLGRSDYSILEWQKLNAPLFHAIEMQKSILTVILSLVGTVAGFNVLAALWMMVVRQTPEIAIMMSMGATESEVTRIFQFAGMVLGAVGCVAGIVFGLILCWLVQLYGYTLDPEVYFIENLPVEISLVQIIAVVVLTMTISFIATLPPSLRAAKLRPVEGLRFE